MSASACPITRTTFATHAKPLTAELHSPSGQLAGGETMLAAPRTFGTGSLGWYSSGKGVVVLDGKPCKVQIATTITVIGSKELPQ